ncbi:uncharacterized protein LOC117121161 [Anneissia japonica]|uniref:uncharacterized protein LOC117121161 n=1 Tax=Anneissia japonica TaxID=1529436 RepID=UPI0014256D0E|nr:uncharacterized protein LOC117121161 [Anneissia japonica]
MENVKSIMLLFLIVVCDSSCPSTWYAIPGSRCIKVVVDDMQWQNIGPSKTCEKFSDDTAVSTFMHVTEENYNATKSLLLDLVPWSSQYYVDWTNDGTDVFDSDGNAVSLSTTALVSGNCVSVDLTTDEVYGSCGDTTVSYVCEMKPCGY